MEIANIEKEIQNLLGLKIKKEILYEWLNELRNKPGFDSSNIINFLRTIVGFIALKEVDLKAVVENEIFEMKLINQEFEVFRVDNIRILQILDVENISETYETRYLDSEKRTLKFKLTDGYMVYQALEQRKLSLNKIAMRYKTIINGKSQPFYLNNLQMKKLVIQAGTIYRRKMFLLTESNAFILEEYDDLYSKHAIPENLTLVNNSISNLNNYNQESNISHEDEFIDEFREYMDDF